MSETKFKVQIFKKSIDSGEFKKAFMDHMMDTAILSTMIPLAMFAIFFHTRFEKHSMLELMLEIMQHFYIQMMTEWDEYSIVPGDIAYYTLKCTRCHQNVSPQGSTGEIWIHAPLAMLHCWDLIQPKDDIDDNELNLMPLLFNSSEC